MGLCFLGWAPLSFKRLFLPIVKFCFVYIRWIAVWLKSSLDDERRLGFCRIGKSGAGGPNLCQPCLPSLVKITLSDAELHVNFSTVISLLFQRQHHFHFVPSIDSSLSYFPNC